MLSVPRRRQSFVLLIIFIDSILEDPFRIDSILEEPFRIDSILEDPFRIDSILEDPFRIDSILEEPGGNPAGSRRGKPAREAVAGSRRGAVRIRGGGDSVSNLIDLL